MNISLYDLVISLGLVINHILLRGHKRWVPVQLLTSSTLTLRLYAPHSHAQFPRLYKTDSADFPAVWPISFARSSASRSHSLAVSLVLLPDVVLFIVGTRWVAALLHRVRSIARDWRQCGQSDRTAILYRRGSDNDFPANGDTQVAKRDTKMVSNGIASFDSI